MAAISDIRSRWAWDRRYEDRAERLGLRPLAHAGAFQIAHADLDAVEPFTLVAIALLQGVSVREVEELWSVDKERKLWEWVAEKLEAQSIQVPQHAALNAHSVWTLSQCVYSLLPAYFWQMVLVWDVGAAVPSAILQSYYAELVVMHAGASQYAPAVLRVPSVISHLRQSQRRGTHITPWLLHQRLTELVSV